MKPFIGRVYVKREGNQYRIQIHTYKQDFIFVVPSRESKGLDFTLVWFILNVEMNGLEPEIVMRKNFRDRNISDNFEETEQIREEYDNGDEL